MKKLFNIAALTAVALGLTACVDGLEDSVDFTYPAQGIEYGTWTYSNPTESDPFEYTLTISPTEAGDTILHITMMYPYGMTDSYGNRIDSTCVRTIGYVTSYDAQSGTVVAEASTNFLSLGGLNGLSNCTVYASLDHTGKRMMTSTSVLYSFDYYEIQNFFGFGNFTGTETEKPKNMAGSWISADGNSFIELGGYDEGENVVFGYFQFGEELYENCAWHYDNTTGTLTMTGLVTGTVTTAAFNDKLQLVHDNGDGTSVILYPTF